MSAPIKCGRCEQQFEDNADLGADGSAYSQLLSHYVNDHGLDSDTAWRLWMDDIYPDEAWPDHTVVELTGEAWAPSRSEDFLTGANGGNGEAK